MCDESVEEEIPPAVQSLARFREIVSICYPQWCDHSTNIEAHLQISKVAQTTSPSLPIITHSITISHDFSWVAYIHGHQVDSSLALFSSVPNKLDANSLRVLLTTLDGCVVCPGHPDSTFVEMAMAKKGHMTSLDGKTVVATVDSFAPVSLNGETYTTTVRHRSCDIIVKSGKCSGNLFIVGSQKITQLLVDALLPPAVLTSAF